MRWSTSPCVHFHLEPTFPQVPQMSPALLGHLLPFLVLHIHSCSFWLSCSHTDGACGLIEGCSDTAQPRPAAPELSTAGSPAFELGAVRCLRSPVWCGCRGHPCYVFFNRLAPGVSPPGSLLHLTLVWTCRRSTLGDSCRVSFPSLLMPPP